MACLNQWDQQSHRLFSVDGAMQTLYAGQNAGGNTVGVMQKVKRKAKNCDWLQRRTKDSKEGYAGQDGRCGGATVRTGD